MEHVTEIRGRAAMRPENLMKETAMPMTPTQERFSKVLEERESMLFPQRIEERPKRLGAAPIASRVMWHRFPTEAELGRRLGVIPAAAFTQAPCGVNFNDAEAPRRTPRRTNSKPQMCPTCFPTREEQVNATAEVLRVYEEVRWKASN